MQLHSLTYSLDLEGLLMDIKVLVSFVLAQSRK